MNGEISKYGDIKSNFNNGKIIKSLFNFKEILNFLGVKKMFDIIIYNKQLQNELGINIEDYKAISGKYKIGEKTGKGKEYKINSNILKFEGEYLNGKRHGKGKEFNKYGKLKFEGEYENGKRNGKGEEYYNSGNLKFEGEYLKGNRWNGKGYDKIGNIEFEINNGTGKGKEYDKYDLLKFEGEYENGKRNGKGEEYYKNRELKFQGEYLNGNRWNGKGFDKEGILNLEIKNGIHTYFFK